MEEGVSERRPATAPISASDGVQVQWKSAFRPYVKHPPSSASAAPGSVRVIVKRPLLARLTKDIVETYISCNPEFKYSESNNPKRFLTSPSAGVKNDGRDNVNSDLILSLDYVLINDCNQRYVVKDILGQGTFGQVAKCQVSETDNYVAVKIIKNQVAYYQQALVEVMILNMLNSKFDPEDKNHIVRVLDYFIHQSHLCITFEMLGSNLYELIRHNLFKGLPLSFIRDFSKQGLQALVVMKEAGVIHCDLKPENILMSTRLNKPEVKIIDFGSACLENQTVYSYIQSRYYRSPEVLLGYPYTTAIDMWSFGCVVAELYLGLPLFPGASEYDLLKRMIDTLGEQPPDHMLRVAKNSSKFFKHVGGFHHFVEDDVNRRERSAYQLLSVEECEARSMKKPAMGKQYFNFVKLSEIVKNYPFRKNISDDEIAEENRSRLALVDFLRGLVEFDPVKRWSPMQAVQHPFVTGEPFMCPYKPSAETPRLHMGQNITVDHNPGGGHWFGAGLSPQVAKVNKGYLHHSSHYQMTPACHPSNYGSLGSYGSYNDGLGHGGSLGSYGDSSIYGCHSSFVGHHGMSIHHPGMSALGVSPDATRWRNPQIPLGNGYGPSPSAGGSVFSSMSLGASPSQYTPPNSQQFPIGSPGKYPSSSSPARSSLTGIHGSPLAKGSTTSQFHGRRNVGYHPGASFMQHQEDAFNSQHFHGHKLDASKWNNNPNGTGRGGSITSPRSTQPANPMSQSWRPQKGGSGASSGLSVCLHHQDNHPLSAMHDSQSTPPSEHSDKLEDISSSPNPGDWDPNYSDELLLQNVSMDMNHLSSAIANGLNLNQPSSSYGHASGARYDHGNIHTRAESRNSASNRRINMGMPLYPQTTPNTFHETSRLSTSQPFSHLVMHVVPQNLPSRFGQPQQQSSNRFQYSHDHSLTSSGLTATSDGSSTGSSYAAPRGAFASSGMSWGNRR